LLQRRSSAGGLEHLLGGGGGYRTTSAGGAIDYGVGGSGGSGLMHSLTSRRPHSSMSGKLGPNRSWHPSPFHSDNDDDNASTEEHQFFKEEKKNRIKMEISRRRQQIEENARLHEELIRLAKLRETAELGGSVGHHPDPHHHRLGSSGLLGYPSPSLSPGGGMRGDHQQPGGVLRSVDEILRNDYHSFGGSGGSHLHNHPSGGSAMMMAGRNGRRDYLGGMTRHSLDDDMLGGGGGGTSFNTDRYTSSVYDR
jgi:hypothetical protein